MEFELRAILKIIWRWAWLLLASTIVGAVISYSATSQMPRLYSATTTLMVGQVLQATNPNAADFSTTEQLAQTYVLLVRRQPLLQATADALKLNVPWQALAGQVTAGVLPNTQLFQITVVDISPQRAAIIADEVAHQLILRSPTPDDNQQDQRQAFVDQQLSDLQTHIKETQTQVSDLQAQLATTTTASGIQDIQNQINALQQKISGWQSTYASLMTSKVGRTNNLSVVEPATGSNVPVSPNVQMNVLTAAAVGFALALAAILLIEYLDDSLRTREDVTRTLQLEFLGAIGRIGTQRNNRSTTGVDSPQSTVVQAFHALRTSIQLAVRRQSHCRLLVTSPGPGEGKTTTAANLAVSFAQAGRTVILCDLDLRRPNLHQLFDSEPGPGLSGLVLNPMLPCDHALIETEQPGLWLLPTGTVPADPTQLLTSPMLTDRMDQLSKLADVLIFDSPGVLAVADTQVIATFASAVVLVVDAKRTRRGAARQTVATLQHAGAQILGVALNRASATQFSSGKYASTPARGIWRRVPARLAELTDVIR